MSDTGDIYRMMRQSKKNANSERFHRARAMFLKEPDQPLEWKQHTPHWWSLMVGADRFDYWPGTVKFRWRGETKRGQPAAVKKFIASILLANAGASHP